MPIRAVIFDAVGTLLHAEPGVGEVYAAAGGRYGSRYPAGELLARFRQAFARQETLDRGAGWATGEEREFRRWQEIVAEVLDDVHDREACFAELYEHFAQPKAWRCEPGAGLALEEWRRRGLVLAMASNFDSRLRRVVAGVPELRAIEHLIISSEIGSRKPAPAFFAACCERLALSPGEILFVGDDVANDYEGARAAGMEAVLVDAHSRLEELVKRLGERGASAP